MKKFCIFAAIVLIIASFVFISMGFYTKDNYESGNVNAYVGGDAYNYIINASYFTGFMVLAIGSFISGTIFLCVAFLLESHQQKINLIHTPLVKIKVNTDNLLSKSLGGNEKETVRESNNIVENRDKKFTDMLVKLNNDKK